MENSEAGGLIHQGEHEELTRRQFDAAGGRYRAALAAARRPWERAYVTLLLARVESKAGRAAEARTHYRNLAQFPADLQDEYGIPFALYAAEPLLQTPSARADVAAALRKVVAAAPALTSPALVMLRNDAAKMALPDLLPDLDRRLYEREQAEVLQGVFPHLLSRLEGDDPLWIPYGKPLWLLGLANSPGSRPLLVAVNPDRLRTLRTRTPETGTVVLGKQGETLGESFPGLRAALTMTPPRNGAPGHLFWYFALSSVVSLTMVAGFLLWRDMRRSERLAEMRSHFISSVSHELRTPLTSIRMYTESMKLDDEMDSEIRTQYLDTVLHESERLSRLVDNVLHFARIEQGRASYQLRPEPVAEIVGKSILGFGLPAEQAGFRLDVGIEPDLPEVFADRDALEQAILNLLGNAIKYSGASREIAVNVQSEGMYAAIRVADHGIGIAPQEQARIFDRFYRSPAAENGQIPGAGLGLTLVDHIARAHGGNVTVTSRLGAGSVFTIRIPFAPVPVTAHIPVAEKI